MSEQYFHWNSILFNLFFLRLQYASWSRNNDCITWIIITSLWISIDGSITHSEFPFFFCSSIVYRFSFCANRLFFFNYALFSSFSWCVSFIISREKKELCFSICRRLKTKNNGKIELLSDLTFSIARLCLCICEDNRTNPYKAWRKKTETTSKEERTIDWKYNKIEALLVHHCQIIQVTIIE
jgi:hypothetical protein